MDDFSCGLSLAKLALFSRSFCDDQELVYSYMIDVLLLCEGKMVL